MMKSVLWVSAIQKEGWGGSDNRLAFTQVRQWSSSLAHLPVATRYRAHVPPISLPSTHHLPPLPPRQDAASETESQAGTSANLHITVEQPSHAVPLMRAANTASANVYTPWAPKMTRAV